MKVSKPLKDTLQKVCAEYNRMVSLKTHRIDSNRKAMAYNMLHGWYSMCILFLSYMASFPSFVDGIHAVPNAKAEGASRIPPSDSQALWLLPPLFIRRGLVPHDTATFPSHPLLQESRWTSWPRISGSRAFTAGLKLLNSMAKIFSGRSWLLRIPPVFCGPVVLHRTLNSLSYAFHLIPLLSWFVLTKNCDLYGAYHFCLDLFSHPQDFMRKAGTDSSRKAKVCHLYPFQKIDTPHIPCSLQVGAQLDEAGHHALHDICCLWCYLLPHLRSEFPDITVKKYEGLFAKGTPDHEKMFGFIWLVPNLSWGLWFSFPKPRHTFWFAFGLRRILLSALGWRQILLGDCDWS